MRISMNSSLLISFFFLTLLQRSTYAIKKSYIVYLGAHSHGPEPSSLDYDRVTDSHHEFLGSFFGSKVKARDAIYYSYTKHINAFSAKLEEKEAAEIAKHQDVISVFLNKGMNLHTTRSWSFLGVENDGIVPSYSIWKKARFGEDIIIGNIDTGVWPESKSFSDEGMGPVPTRWRGICQQEEGVRCNRKLIGARYFSKGYADAVGQVNFSLNTARDHYSHGTHTLSTAGGNFVSIVNISGIENGTVKGGSPKARVASYKACWLIYNNSKRCYASDIIAAFDAAIADGVDVLSVSLGFPLDYVEDPIAIGAFHAVMNGIVVVGSAGNDGHPYKGFVTNVAPWIITVGASKIERDYSNIVVLGNKEHFKGISLLEEDSAANKSYPLISGRQAAIANATSENGAIKCEFDQLDAKKIEGKIVVCQKHEEGFYDSLTGAAGIIFVDEEGRHDPINSSWDIPTSQINYIDGQAVHTYINSTKNPIAYITWARAKLDVKSAPTVAGFSSTGPNFRTPEILKPDIIAPGVKILAASTQSTGVVGFEQLHEPGSPYALKDGTSMATPHVAGVVGLLKTLYPDWSPAAIRSAIMTTAFTPGNSTSINASPITYGAGHIRPNEAIDPGLVYDLSNKDYFNFLCTIGYNKTQIEQISKGPFSCSNISLADFNNPAIVISNLSGTATVTRIVKNVGTPRSTYIAKVEAPPKVSISIKPAILTFERIGEEKKFELTLKGVVNGSNGDFEFGNLVWSDGKHYVRSPIVIYQARTIEEKVNKELTEERAKQEKKKEGEIPFPPSTK